MTCSSHRPVGNRPQSWPMAISRSPGISNPDPALSLHDSLIGVARGVDTRPAKVVDSCQDTRHGVEDMVAGDDVLLRSPLKENAFSGQGWNQQLP